MDIDKLKFFECFLDLTAELFLVLDRQGCVVYINQQGCEILKDDEENILDCNWFDSFFDIDMNEEVKNVYLELVAGNIEFAHFFENSIITKQNQLIKMSWNNAALYDDAGKIQYVLSVGRDITHEKILESNLKASSMALDAAMEELNY